MSTAVMAACWPLQMPPPAKAVLMSLADNCNDNGECEPSIQTLCKRTCLHRATVIRAIEELERIGQIVATHRQGARTRYTVTPKTDLFDPEPVAESDQSQRATSRQKVVAQRDPLGIKVGQNRSHCATQSKSKIKRKIKSSHRRRNRRRRVSLFLKFQNGSTSRPGMDSSRCVGSCDTR